MDLHVSEGQIRVNEPWQVINHRDVKVWEIDLNSKYPAGTIMIAGFDEKSNTMGVLLYADDRTLRADREKPPTQVWIEHPENQNWSIIADWARYTVRLTFYKYPERL